MAQYLVKQRSYINGGVVEAGTTVDYDPPPGTTISENLEPVAGETTPAGDPPAAPVKGKKAKPGGDAPAADGSN